MTPLTFGVGFEFTELNFQDRLLGVSFYEANFQNLHYVEKIFANDMKALSNLTIIFVLECNSRQWAFSDIENKLRLVKTFIKNVTSGLSEEDCQLLKDKFTEVHELFDPNTNHLIPTVALMHKFDKYLTSDVSANQLDQVSESADSQITERSEWILSPLLDRQGHRHKNLIGSAQCVSDSDLHWSRAEFPGAVDDPRRLLQAIQREIRQ